MTLGHLPKDMREDKVIASFYIINLEIFESKREEKGLNILTVKSCSLESSFKCIHISLSSVTNRTKDWLKKNHQSKQNQNLPKIRTIFKNLLQLHWNNFIIQKLSNSALNLNFDLCVTV